MIRMITSDNIMITMITMITQMIPMITKNDNPMITMRTKMITQ